MEMDNVQPEEVIASLAVDQNINKIFEAGEGAG